jgi:hypothetical protein
MWCLSGIILDMFCEEHIFLDLLTIFGMVCHLSIFVTSVHCPLSIGWVTVRCPSNTVHKDAVPKFHINVCVCHRCTCVLMSCCVWVWTPSLPLQSFLGPGFESQFRLHFYRPTVSLAYVTCSQTGASGGTADKNSLSEQKTCVHAWLPWYMGK